MELAQAEMAPLSYDYLVGDSPAKESPIANDSVSDCGSGVTGSSSPSNSSGATSRRRREGIFDENLLVELSEGERIYEVICRRFLSSLESDYFATLTSIHRRNWSGISAQAKIQSFQIHSRAMATKHGGNPNVKFAWYGDRRERIESILSHGFSHLEARNNINGAILLSPDDSPAHSLEGSIADEDGLRHLLLCRVLLGRSEVVESGSTQTHPSSPEFDSGVDSVENPKKYMIWSSNMNTHILPEYVVSFRVTAPPPSSSLRGVSKLKMPVSPWISFPTLISVLGKYLPSDAISLINKYHKDYKEGKFSRPELIQKVRQLAGDKLLIAVIKSCRGAKGLKTQFGFARNRNTNN